MKTRAKIWLAAVVATGVAAAIPGCGGRDHGPAGPPVPGVLSVVLTTPNADDGGIIFSVAGGPVDSVVGAAYGLHSARLGPSSMRILAHGALAGGTTLALIAVPDIAAAAQYTATIEQVAARSTWIQRATAGYQLPIVR